VEPVNPRTQRLIGISGLVFIAIVAASIFVTPNSPSSTASATKVVAYYHVHKTAAGVSGHLISLAVSLALFFFWYLRDFISTTLGTKRLATIGFAGAVLFAVSGGLAAGAFYAINDTVGHVDPSTIQTLSLLQGDVSDGLGEAGVAVFLLASSIAILRGSGRMPGWVAWLGIVLGIASLLVFGLGLPAMGLWLLISCITMLVRTNSATTPTANKPEPALA
jgi:hypothetical protein